MANVWRPLFLSENRFVGEGLTLILAARPEVN